MALAHQALLAMGAVQATQKPGQAGGATLSLTAMGRAMASLPLSPRHARMLLQASLRLSLRHLCLYCEKPCASRGAYAGEALHTITYVTGTCC